MPQSGPGRIVLFDDFFNGVDKTDITDNSTIRDIYQIGPFSLFGEGTIEIDNGAFQVNALSGVVRLTCTNVGDDSCCLGTFNCFDVGLMGTIVLEARIQFNNLDTKRCFFGLTDADDGGTSKKLLSIEDDIVASTTLTFTPVASDYVGFLLSSEMTDATDWHFLYRGGSAAMTSGAVSATYDLNDVAAAGVWQILRLEVDNNGTARWYIDGELLQTVENACSTTADMGVVLGVEAVGNNVEEMDVDYLLVEANRDWTV